MEFAVARNNVFAEMNNFFPEKYASEDKFIWTTMQGKFDRTETFDLCNSRLHNEGFLGLEVPTLLELFDAFDIEDSDDYIVEEYTGRIFYPVRVAILRSLLSYPDSEEMQDYLKATDHKALRLRAEAKKGNLSHQVANVVCSESANCVCMKSLSAKDVLVCKFCDTVLCKNCVNEKCAFVLMGYINAQEIEECSSEDSWSEDSEDDEDELESMEESEEDEDMDENSDDEDQLESMVESDDDEEVEVTSDGEEVFYKKVDSEGEMSDDEMETDFDEL